MLAVVRAQTAIVRTAALDGSFRDRRRGGAAAALTPAAVRLQAAPDDGPELAVFGAGLTR
jgi:hypothetical protein